MKLLLRLCLDLVSHILRWDQSDAHPVSVNVPNLIVLTSLFYCLLWLGDYHHTVFSVYLMFSLSLESDFRICGMLR